MGIYDKELTCFKGGYIWVEENSNLILPLTIEFSIICGWTEHLWLHAWVSLLKLLLFIVLNSLLSWLHGMAKTAKAPWYCSIFIFCTTKCTNYTNSVSQKHHVKNGGQNTYNCPTAGSLSPGYHNSSEADDLRLSANHCCISALSQSQDRGPLQSPVTRKTMYSPTGWWMFVRGCWVSLVGNQLQRGWNMEKRLLVLK